MGSDWGLGRRANWAVHGLVHGVMRCGGWDNCICILPGLMRLDFGVGGGLDGDGVKVVGVASSMHV